MNSVIAAYSTAGVLLVFLLATADCSYSGEEEVLAPMECIIDGHSGAFRDSGSLCRKLNNLKSTEKHCIFRTASWSAANDLKKGGKEYCLENVANRELTCDEAWQISKCVYKYM